MQVAQPSAGPEEEEVEEEVEGEIDFSPDAVADYLYRTGDFNRFYAALAQLVNASIVSAGPVHVAVVTDVCENTILTLASYPHSWYYLPAIALSRLQPPSPLDIQETCR